MKFIISRQELAELVNRVQNIVAPKTPIPILSNFLLEAQDSRLILTATDLTVGVRCVGEAKVIEPGATTLPARRFAQLVRELTAMQVEISTNSKDVTNIVADASTFRVHGLPRTDFPGLPDLTGATKVQFTQGQLKDALYRTSFAVSKEDNRYVLTGVFCHITGSQAIFVGTDGKRLARTSIAISADAGSNFECIIPLKAVDEILKSLTNEDEPATLSVLADKIAVEANDTLIVSKLLSGDYPDVDRVIPSQSNCVVSLHREELTSLLRQVSLFTTEDNHSARFTLSKGEMHVNANTMDVGEGKVSMPVNYDGDRFDIAFNPQYFIDILRHSKNETVSLGFTDAYNPGIIVDGVYQPQEQELPNPLFVLMPLRLSEE
ncbi:MAG: DNA polymerase III subunit beta [Verrucomicrobia bacterium]|nr:DNA polymerase III subunit beta [Verrucomicrobiota bacterium]MBS0637255.1 DNA polymerase III subunit beta [Verrucomicrobiota bacterium]